MVKEKINFEIENNYGEILNKEKIKLEKLFFEKSFKTNGIGIRGPDVDSFEKEIAEYIGANSTLALSTSIAAINFAIKLLGIGIGDLVFCSSLAVAQTCNVIIHEGAEPVFIDSEVESFNMSPIALERAFKYYYEKGTLPKAVLVAHIYGQSADMDKIMAICNQYNVPVIEDASESIGASYKEKLVGTIGKYGIYSFDEDKIITASSGGMLVSKSGKSIKKGLYILSRFKKGEKNNLYYELGDNCIMSNIIAEIGRGQLRVINDRIEKKKYIYEKYKAAFSDIEEIKMASTCDYGSPNYWMSIMTLNIWSKIKVSDIILALEKENIESRTIRRPLNMQSYYKKYNFFSHYSFHGISVGEDIFTRGICLPSDTNMNDYDLQRVIEIIQKMFIRK